MVAPTGSFNRLPRIARAIGDRVGRVNRVAAFNIQQRAVQSFGGGKSGRRYKVNGRMHTASAPGEAPGVLYGTLSNSVFTDHPDVWESFVYSVDEKAPHLEFGTIHMAPRPWLGPAAKDEKEDYVRAITIAIQGASKA